ncbi:hypothetical protein B0H13DRAFT_2312335 [Mycena leptocephala]|nr:hypothetical protein B0H13DRAFT_2312335 [Mycena leptocephala]
MERRFSCYGTPPRTHVGPTCLPTAAFLIALPYGAPVRPKPPALTTKRVHATRLFGAVCQHPRPDQRVAVISCLLCRRLAPSLGPAPRQLVIPANPSCRQSPAYPCLSPLRFSTRCRRRPLLRLYLYAGPSLAAPLLTSSSRPTAAN